jgi:DNA-binding transcriptional LysR family regulator
LRQVVRSRQIVESLTSLEIDFGVVTPSRVVHPLKCCGLGELQYSLFIPKSLLTGGTITEEALEGLPIATQATDSRFNAELLEASRKANTNINLRLYCESFPEARQALLSESYAAILPHIAALDLPASQFHEVRPKYLKALKRQISLAWNPRLIQRRPDGEKILEMLRDTFKEEIAW